MTSQSPDKAEEREPEPGLESETVFQIGDAMPAGCAMAELMEGRFEHRLARLAQDAAGLEATQALQSALATAYQAALAQAGFDGRVSELVCGLRFCMVELHLAGDASEDPIWESIATSLLGPEMRTGVSAMLPNEDGSRQFRRVWSVTEAVNRIHPGAIACSD